MPWKPWTPRFPAPKLVCVGTCPDCGGKVDQNGDTMEDGHCSECPNHNGHGCDCETCGYTQCDQSC